MSFLDIVKAFIPLIIIVGLLYGVLVFIKKYGASFKGNKAGLVPIKVLSTQMIMPKKFISIVKVDNKLLVLGVSENSITMLKELERTVEVEETAYVPKNENNLIDILKKNLGIK
ncbi:MAG: flagellar biosynthetic protein FliO [Ignavibacteriaceae bacterium]|nr:flagellar biosynthetic protein FliO [Ignavibacteriaceae bacterium]